MTEFRKIISAMTEKKYLMLLLLLGVVVLLGALEIRPIEGGDETRVAGIGAEIAIEGNWIVPKLNGIPFLEYPPCFYWMEAFFFHVFGICDFAAKLPAALGGFLMIFSVFGIARKFHEDAFSAFVCSSMLLFSAQIFEKTRCCMVDALLAGFIALAVWMFVECVYSEKTGRKILFFALFSIACGFGMFTKGLIGLVLPCSMLGSWILFGDILQKKFSLQKYLLLAAGALCSFVIPGIWVALLYRQAGYPAVYEVVVTNNFGRFTGSQGDHIESCFYYLKKLPGQFVPWTALLPFGLYYHWKCVKKEKNVFSLFILCALLVPYLLLTVSASKRQVYLLPLYSFEALLIGTMAARLLSGKISLPVSITSKLQKLEKLQKLQTLLPYVYAGCLIAGSIVFLCMSLRNAHAYAFVYPVMTILCCGLLIYLTCKKNLSRGLFVFLFGTALFFISIDAGPFYNPDGENAYFLFFEKVQDELDRTSGRLVLDRKSMSERLRGACVYYLGYTVPATDRPQKGDLLIYTEKRVLKMRCIE